MSGNEYYVEIEVPYGPGTRWDQVAEPMTDPDEAEGLFRFLVGAKLHARIVAYGPTLVRHWNDSDLQPLPPPAPVRDGAIYESLMRERGDGRTVIVSGDDEHKASGFFREGFEDLLGLAEKELHKVFWEKSPGTDEPAPKVDIGPDGKAVAVAPRISGAEPPAEQVPEVVPSYPAVIGHMDDGGPVFEPAPDDLRGTGLYYEPDDDLQPVTQVLPAIKEPPLHTQADAVDQGRLLPGDPGYVEAYRASQTMHKGSAPAPRRASRSSQANA